MRYKLCPQCGGEPTDLAPMAKHDSFWCEKCDIWLEEKACGSPTCEFCGTRPEKPSMVEDRRPW